MAGILDVLNSLERTRLRVCEATIQRHLGTFVEVGTALAEIRDKRLYRESHKTFEKYVAAKWDFKKDYAYRLIAASGVVKNISEGAATNGGKDVDNCQQKPTSEAQARALVELSPEQQPVAWRAAVEKAEEEGKPLTAAIVKQVVEEMKPAAEGSGKPESKAEEEEPDLAASVLTAINTEAIKPTKEQRAALAAMEEEDQDAIVEAVLAERQTLRQAITDGPAEAGPEEIGKNRATNLDRICRALSKIVADQLPQDDPWVEEKKALIEGDLRALKNTICSCKATHLCPKCAGAGCATCKRTGRVSKYTLDKVS